MSEHHGGRSLLDPRDDAGTTLLEVIVAMTLMSIFMGIFTTATLMMTRTTTKVQAVAESSEQVNTAFLTLEKSIRYSTGISTPNQTGGPWNVEFGSPDTVVGSGRQRCTQLKVENSQLLQRTWMTSGNVAVPGTRSGWRPLASGITNGGESASSSNRPFQLAATSAIAASPFQRLTVTVRTSSSAGSSASTAESRMTFAAQNSKATSTTEPCQDFGATS